MLKYSTIDEALIKLRDNCRMCNQMAVVEPDKSKESIRVKQPDNGDWESFSVCYPLKKHGDLCYYHQKLSDRLLKKGSHYEKDNS